MSKLDALIDSAPIFQKLTPLDCCVMISDAEGTIRHFVAPKDFTMNVQVGSKVPPTGSIGECITTKREVHKVLPKELYGVPIKAISIPVVENGTFIGVIATATSLMAQEALQSSAETIAATAQEITATSQEIAEAATKLAMNFEELKGSAHGVLEEVNKTDDILKFVSDVAANSNLLGLNAAIEAARAGEHGRGFAVVAEEIRKMAVNSQTAVNNIKGILAGIQQKSGVIVKTVDETAVLAERQAAATEEISAAMQQLTSSTSEIEKVAKII